MKAIKEVDVVLSAVGFMQLADQVKIISAIKEAGNVKVSIFGEHIFLPLITFHLSIKGTKIFFEKGGKVYPQFARNIMEKYI